MRIKLNQKKIVSRKSNGFRTSLFVFLSIFLLNVETASSQEYRLYSNQGWISESAVQDAVVKSYSVVDAYGYLYVAGASLNTSGNYDVYLSKINPSGSLEWDFVKNGLNNSNDFASFIYVDVNRNIYLTGGLTDSNSDSLDMFITKLDSSGNEMWTNKKRGAVGGVDGGSYIFADTSGFIYVVGSILENASKHHDLLVCKYSSTGISKWDKIYDINGFEDIGIKGEYDPTIDAIKIVALSQSDTVLKNWDVTEIQFLASGGLFLGSWVFQTNFQGQIITVNDVQRGIFGELYILGQSMDTLGNIDISLVSLDGQLNENWRINIDGGYSNNGLGVDLVCDSGYIYILGEEVDANSNSYILMSKVDISGSVLWTQSYGMGSQNKGSTILVDDRGIFVSYSSVNDGSNSHMSTICLDHEGSTVWKWDYNDGADVYCNAGILDDSYYYAIGQTYDGSVYNYVTVVYELLNKENVFSADVSTDTAYVENELIVFFDKSAILASSAFDTDKKTFGNLNEYLTSTAIASIRNDFTDDDIDIGYWKFIPLLPDWTSADTLSINRNGDTMDIGVLFASGLLICSENYNIISIADSLKLKSAFITSVSVNRVFSGDSALLCHLPNDTEISSQLNYSSPNFNRNIDIKDLHCLFDANSFNWVYGLPSVKVGIMDSGINWGHEDLNGSSNTNPSASKSRVKGGKCYFCTNQPSVFSADPNINDIAAGGHGTQVAGIIGAIGNNNKGITGIAGGFNTTSFGSNQTTGVELYDIKTINNNLTVSQAVSAILDAASSTTGGNGFGVHYLNHSWGFPLNSALSDRGFEGFTPLFRAFGYAYKSGVCHVNASGNENKEMRQVRSNGYMPDKYSIMVGATDQMGVRAKASEPYSNYSNSSYKTLDLSAPVDELVFSTASNSTLNGYTTSGLSGTSFAAPQVAAGAALLQSYMDFLNNGIRLAVEDVEFLLELGAKYYSGQSSYEFDSRGHGLLKIKSTFDLIESSQNSIYQVSNDQNNPYFSSATYSTVLEQSNFKVDFVKGSISGSSAPEGVYYADVYQVNCTLNYDLGQTSYIQNFWPRHSATSGLERMKSDIYTRSTGEPSIFYETDTYNELGAYSHNSSIGTGTAYMRSYFYKVTKDKNNNAITNFWLPFDPSISDPKFAFTFRARNWATGVEEVSEDSWVKVYPNPALKEFNIDLPSNSNDLTVEIYSVLGQQVLRKVFETVEGNNVKIETSDLSSGTYFVKLTSSAGLSETHKLVISVQ